MLIAKTDRKRPAVEIRGTGIVYRNLKPHLRSRHAYFPTAAQLDNDELIVCMDIGSAFESVDMRSFLCRSSNLGQSWSEPKPLFEPDQASHPISTSCRMGMLDDGSLLGWVGLFDRTKQECGLVNPDTDGFCPTDYGTIISLDGGHTWSGLQPAKITLDWRQFEVCAPPKQVSQDRLLIVTHPFLDWEGRSSRWGRNGVALVSEDKGNTWTSVVELFVDHEKRFAFYESALTRLSDGRLLAMCWAMDIVEGVSAHNRTVISTDKGQTFGTPRETPLLGETCRPLGLPDNHVLVVYRRIDKKGLWAHLAKIEGNDWIVLDDRLLWGGNVTSHRTDLGGALAELSTLRFGCPAVLQLSNGEVFVVFWAIEDCCSVIRWLRLNVD